MPEPKPVKAGDPCPNCGEALKPAPFPSPELYAAARDRENPRTLPAHYDTATVEQHRELGTLYRCACGYVTRILGAEPSSSSEAARA